MAYMVNGFVERIRLLIVSMGYEFVGVEKAGGGNHLVFRVYIDKEHGITVYDCEKVSRQISALFDVENPITGHYNLEVSSPGLNRPLFTLEQFKKVLGKQIKVQLKELVQERRRLKGILNKVTATDIYLIIEDEEIVLAFSNVEKANVIADIKMK